MMSKKEVEALTDEQLKSEWEQITVAIRAGLGQNLNYHQGIMFFAMFVNVGAEMRRRKLKT